MCQYSIYTKIPAVSEWWSARSVPGASALALLSFSYRRRYLHLDRLSWKFEVSLYVTGAARKKGIHTEPACKFLLSAVCMYTPCLLTGYIIYTLTNSLITVSQGPGCYKGLHLCSQRAHGPKQQTLIMWTAEWTWPITWNHTGRSKDKGPGHPQSNSDPRQSCPYKSTHIIPAGKHTPPAREPNLLFCTTSSLCPLAGSQ